MLGLLFHTVHTQTHRVVNLQLVVLHVVRLLQHNQIEIHHSNARNPEAYTTGKYPIPISDYRSNNKVSYSPLIYSSPLPNEL